MRPKTEKDLLLETEARNCKQRGVKKTQRPRCMVWVKKVRKVGWHSNVTDTKNEGK